MVYDAKHIMLGLAILFTLVYVIIFAFSLLYQILVLKEEKIQTFKESLAVVSVTLLWFVATTITLWTAGSASVWLFGLMSFVLLAIPMYFSVEKLFGVTGKHKIIYAASLALIINPIWLVFLGIS